MDEITVALLLKLVTLLVGIISFIGLLSLDVWKAWKSKAHWVPQGALVLSALSLQLLNLLDTDNVRISDIIRGLPTELLINGGREMVCVYMGYLLPEMVRSPSHKEGWSDTGALAISVITHICSELYVLMELYLTPSLDNNVALTPNQANIGPNPLSIASRLCTAVCTSMLFFLLGSAAIGGKTLCNLVCEKIPLVVRKKPEDYLKKSYSPETVEKDVLQSWVVAWVCKPDYIIARSVLASSVGVVVTLSVACYAAECLTQDYKVLHVNDGIDWFRYTVTAFMVLLILIGWSIIFYRWMFAIFYFPGKYKIANHVEDFWIRHIYELADAIEYPRPSWDQHVSGGGFPENPNLGVLRKLKAHNLLRYPLLHLQRRVIWFSKLCFFLSQKIFFVDKIRSRIVGAADPDFPEEAFMKVLKELKMPGETEEYLLAGSLKALKQTKGFMEEGRKIGWESESLVQLLSTESTDQNSKGKMFLETLRKMLSGERLSEECLETLRKMLSGELNWERLETLREMLSRELNRERLETPCEKSGKSVEMLETLLKRLSGGSFDYLKMLSWKMTALSLLQVIIKLEGHAAVDVMNAYSEAYDFLDLLDNTAGTQKDFCPQLFVRAADKPFIVLQKKVEDPEQHLGRNRASNPGETGTIKEARQKVRVLQEGAPSHVSYNSNDFVDWWAIAVNNNLDKVCTIILENDTSSDTDLMKKEVRSLLADMLAIALKEEVGRELVNNCRGWAEILEDEKISASVYIAGKLSGVLAKLDKVIAERSGCQ